MPSLEKRVALVTGAGGGIGAAICHRLSKEGAFVIAADLNFDNARKVADQLRRGGGGVLPIPLDVTNQLQWRSAVAETLRVAGGLDILVNNAGVAHIKPLEAVSVDEWNADINVNLNSAFLGIKESLNAMRESAKRSPSGASIINIASVSALVGSPGMPAYSASKGGLRLFSKAIALDFAKRRYGIRVNSIYPGLIDTSLTTPLFESMRDANSNKDIETIRAEVIQGYPIGRIGRPEEIAGVVCFLAGDDSSYMIGAELIVDGGLTAQ
jgi:NAD(P)-dependent dehydrogenase (short-subunit alcohol dehydrogenase family)